MEDNILLAKEDAGVLTLTLNRPDVMNSLSFPLLHALRDQIESVRFRSDIRVVIITGQRGKGFLCRCRPERTGYPHTGTGQGIYFHYPQPFHIHRAVK